MTHQPQDNTRERILDHAERLFAVKGFGAVSIREITGAAGSNLAAVNYHFGNKTNLYIQVFRERWVHRTHRIRERFSKLLADKPEPTIKDVIGAMARAFLDGPLNDEEQCYHVMLMQRELAQPGEALKMVVEEVMRPYQQELRDLIRPNLSPDVSEEGLRLCLIGVMGMTLHFTFARPAVSMVLQRDYDERFKNQLIEQITFFSVHGISALEKGGSPV
jgi:AcrR family transcriptional regulator